MTLFIFDEIEMTATLHDYTLFEIIFFRFSERKGRARKGKH